MMLSAVRVPLTPPVVVSPHATLTNSENHIEVSNWLDSQFRKAKLVASGKLHSVSSALTIGTVQIDEARVADIGRLSTSPHCVSVL
jgi:hypothetical protein